MTASGIVNIPLTRMISAAQSVPFARSRAGYLEPFVVVEYDLLLQCLVLGTF